MKEKCTDLFYFWTSKGFHRLNHLQGESFQCSKIQSKSLNMEDAKFQF